MYRKQFILICLLSALVFFISCEKEVLIETGHPEKLCLNCILNPDSLVTASLTLSRDVENSSNFNTVDNATLELYTDNGFHDTLVSLGSGRYQLNHQPLEGVSYNMVVNHNGRNKIRATTTVPGRASVSWITDTTHISSPASGSRVFVRVDMSVHDNPNETNYYWMKSIETNAVFIDDFNRDIDTESKYGYVYYSYIRFSDIGYNGQDMDLTFERRSGIKWYLWSCDTHYDQYLKSTYKARLNAEKDLPFREPVQIYSNIENGYGIFGAVAATQIKF
ncbi:DUF4249 domain-containing protein [uncultured Draconibacterium sp.]|uniref:DUF4249 domain-containing protein n=1 Tax=uncultured Draconibacterium sp. TaxID=1573823 RepID=UPI0032616A61